MPMFKITLEIEIDERWLEIHAGREETAIGNAILQMLETQAFAPTFNIEVNRIN